MALIDGFTQTLLAEVQIVHSQRSIAEAESVTKLTELAFVFIPLAFVASLFSMQVHELEEGVPLYHFILVAIGFILFAYAVRLSVRSTNLLYLRNKLFTQIRKSSQLQENDPIPTHTFMAWISHTIGSAIMRGFVSWSSLIISATLIAAMLSPIVTLWLRGIDKGFSAIVTLIILHLDLVLIGTFAFGFELVDPRVKEWLNGIYRKFTTHEKKRLRVKRRRDLENIEMT
jgi:hypothetical protein